MFSSNFEYDEHPESDCIIRITCSTSDSPPTMVQWFRDGQIIEMDGANYISEQIVTDRRNMYYNNVLCVMNPGLVAGRHEFQCRVLNTRGSHTHSINTEYVPGKMWCQKKCLLLCLSSKIKIKRMAD